MKIGIDIDDTLAQTTNYLIPFAIDFNKNVLNKNNEPDLTKDLLKCFGWNKEETLSFIHTIFEKHALNIPPIDNAKSILKKLREEGNNIIIITARNDSQLSDPYGLTEKWLEINGIEYDKLIVNAKYKGPIVEEEQIDLFIDDSIGQCTFIADHNKVPVILYAKESNDIEYKGIVRLTNWNQIYEYIKNLRK